MTRDEKKSKLANAIREYRGCTYGIGGPWKRRPVPSARSRVLRWLTKLGLGLAISMERIDNFKTMEEFQSWMQTL